MEYAPPLGPTPAKSFHLYLAVNKNSLDTIHFLHVNSFPPAKRFLQFSFLGRPDRWQPQGLSSKFLQHGKRNVMNRLRKSTLLFAAFPLFFATSLAQNAPTGVVTGSTQITAGPVNIDMATGHMIVDIPVRHKIGAFPFAFDLINDSGNQGGVNDYQTFLWSMPSTAMTGFSTPSPTLCGTPPYQSYQFGTGLPNQWYVSDGTGATHSFAFPPINVGVSTCGGQIGPITRVATDGSGYTAIVTGSNQANGSLTWIVYNKDGVSYSGSQDSFGTSADPDGNTIFSSTSNGINSWTDTLGQAATISLSYGGGEQTGGHNANPDKYYYTDESGTDQYYTVNYSLNTVTTVFGCGSPYGDVPTGTQWYQPSSITTPAGSYGFTYEATGSQYPGAVTGRLAKVTLPNGGYVAFAYSGGTAGFNCTSRVIPTLQVTINDNNGNTNTTTYVNSNTASFEDPCCANFTVTVTGNADPDNGGACSASCKTRHMGPGLKLG